MEVFVWISYVRNGLQLWQSVKFCFRFVHFCAIRTPTILLCPKLLVFSKTIAKNITNAPRNGPKSTPCKQQYNTVDYEDDVIYCQLISVPSTSVHFNIDSDGDIDSKEKGNSNDTHYIRPHLYPFMRAIHASTPRIKFFGQLNIELFFVFHRPVHIDRCWKLTFLTLFTHRRTLVQAS